MANPGDPQPGPTATAEASLPANYFEIYKLAVEMADRISARRMLANTFFVTINMGLTALLGSHPFRWYVPAAGVVLSAAWWALLRSYRDLNNAKYRVIHTMEQRLPARIFFEEWAALKREAVQFAPKPRAIKAWLAQYRELGTVERVVPWLFAGIYLIDLLSRVDP